MFQHIIARMPCRALVDGITSASLGKPDYPNLVRAAWERHWGWKPQQLAAAGAAAPQASAATGR